MTALTLASYCGHTEIAHLLLKFKADPNIHDKVNIVVYTTYF